MTGTATITPQRTLSLFSEFSDMFKSDRKKYWLAMNLGELMNLNDRMFEPGYPMRKSLANAVNAIKTASDKVNEAELFYATPEMVELIDHAARVMDSTDKIDKTIIPSDVGFCYLDGGLKFNGPSIIIHGLFWVKTSANSWDIFSFNDKYSEPDKLSTAETNVNLGGQWALSFMATVYHNGPIYNDELWEKAGELAEVLASDESIVKTETTLSAYFHAIFLLMQQERVVDRSERVTSPNKKKVTLLKKEGKPSDVVVVRLRKARYVGDGDTRKGGIEYSVRWFVSAHWRWQPYKNEDGVSDYKRILISPYIKGPEDKPLKISQRVVAIVK